METKICNTCHQEKPTTGFRPSKTYKDGRESRCRDCHPQYKSVAEGTRICNTCHQEKSITRFRPNKYSPDGREAKCKDCMPSVKAYHKAYRETHRREEHERHYALHKKDYLRRSLKYFHKRRSAEGSFTEEEWTNLCKSFSNRCACCGKEGKLTIDHIAPISLGGTNYIKNIQPLCRNCNSKKHTNATDYRT